MRKWVSNNSKVLSFFILVIITSALYCVMQKCSLDQYEERQHAIITHFDKHIKTIEEELSEKKKYVQVKPSVADSAYADLNLYCQQFVKQQDAFQQNIRNILELEYNKIQSEYESQEIWIGLITIVFLVFSFFSMFKAEQLEKESTENAKNIKEMEKQCSTTIDSIKKSENEIREEYENEISALNKEGEKTISRIECRYNKKIEDIQKSFDSWQKAHTDLMDSQVNTFIHDTDRLLKEEAERKYKEISIRWTEQLSKLLQDKYDIFETDYENTMNKYKEKTMSEFQRTFQKLMEDISDQFDGAIRKNVEQYMEKHTATEEEINKMFADFNEDNSDSKEAQNIIKAENANMKEEKNNSNLVK